MNTVPKPDLSFSLVHRSILGLVDPADVSRRARIESRNREVHLPPISVFRWWARRTEAVNGAVIDALTEMYGDRQLVVDPFAGGGTIGLAALARGHRAYVQDINPWSVHGLRTMLALPDELDLKDGSRALSELAAPMLKRAYETTCSDGSNGQLLHTFRVAVGSCTNCGVEARLFPYSVLTLLTRKEKGKPEAYLACPSGHVFLGTSASECNCPVCGARTDPTATYTAMRTVRCDACGHTERLQAKASAGGLRWDTVLVQRARPDGSREFAIPTDQELAQGADESWPQINDLGAIPVGRETSVLLRHGFRRWNDLYPRRQQFITQSLLDLISALDSPTLVKNALNLAIIGTVEFAGHLCRWDRWYLKCNDSTAGHRFNFTTFVPEPNVWGVGSAGRGTVERRLRSFIRGSRWLHERTNRDLTLQCLSNAARQVDIPSDVTVVQGTSERLVLRDGAADIVLTDPPYHDDVQYGELSLLFRCWAGLSMNALEGEASVNQVVDLNTGGDAYMTLLTRIFRECRRVLRLDGRLVFSYANRDPLAWVALFRALEDAGFRALGYAVVHSENETDYAKRDVRACTKDFLMELVPLDSWQVEQSRFDANDEEGDFLRFVGDTFLQIGSLRSDWARDLETRLRDTAFLKARSTAGKPARERTGG